MDDIHSLSSQYVDPNEDPVAIGVTRFEVSMHTFFPQ